MNILIAGGTGLIGKELCQHLKENNNNNIWVLTRGNPKTQDSGIRYVHWDGKTREGWGGLVSQMDAIINLAGEPLTRWPWTIAQKRKFYESRVFSGRALVEAIQSTLERPKLLIQISGINHYGVEGVIADESTLPGEDYLSHLTVDWEEATSPVEELGLRRCVARLAVVLSRDGGLFPIMKLPVDMFVGGPIGSGKQILPWIHIEDVIGAIDFLIHNENSSGPYNLVAPDTTENAIFNRNLARALNRPYWFRIPSFLMKLILGEMSILILKGRGAVPRKLLEEGFHFKYGNLNKAIEILVK